MCGRGGGLVDLAGAQLGVGTFELSIDIAADQSDSRDERGRVSGAMGGGDSLGCSELAVEGCLGNRAVVDECRRCEARHRQAERCEGLGEVVERVRQQLGVVEQFLRGVHDADRVGLAAGLGEFRRRQFECRELIVEFASNREQLICDDEVLIEVFDEIVERGRVLVLLLDCRGDVDLARRHRSAASGSTRNQSRSNLTPWASGSCVE